MAGEPDPHWPRDAARAVAHEVAAFAATLAAVVIAPARFAAEWSAGERRALNPLAFQLNALAVIGPWRVLWTRILDPTPPAIPLWWELGRAMVPLVGLMLGMTLCHVLLKLFGAERPLRSTVAVALFVAGGPIAALSIVAMPLSLYGFLHPRDPRTWLPNVVLNLGLMVLLLVYQTKMLRAVHRLPRWRVVLAALVTWSAYGAFWGWMSFAHHDLVHALLEG